VTYRGRIQAGAILLDEPPELPEGARVRCVLTVESPDEQAQDLKRPCHAGLLKFAGIVKDSPPDAARDLDHYLYGRRKQ
jgi:hypothetical protein